MTLDQKVMDELEDCIGPVWAMRLLRNRRSGVLRTEPLFGVSALRAPAAIAEVWL